MSKDIFENYTPSYTQEPKEELKSKISVETATKVERSANIIAVVLTTPVVFFAILFMPYYCVDRYCMIASYPTLPETWSELFILFCISLAVTIFGVYYVKKKRDKVDIHTL